VQQYAVRAVAVRAFVHRVQWNDDDNSAYLHVSDIQKCPSLTDEQTNTLAVAPLRWDLVAGVCGVGGWGGAGAGWE
jgi:hypothetical protein